MKRANILQLTFVIIGVVYGIFCLPVIFSLVVSTFVMMVNGGMEPGQYLLFNIFSITAIALQILACWLLITRSEKWSAIVQKRSGLGNGFSITSKPNELLYILLIVIGIYLLLLNLGPLLTGMFSTFRSRISTGMLSLLDERPIEWGSLILKVILPLILLMFARPIADYFAKNITREPVVLDENVTDDLITAPKED